MSKTIAHRLSEISERAEKASPIWKAETDKLNSDRGYYESKTGWITGIVEFSACVAREASWNREEDFDFVLNARNDIKFLLGEIARLQDLLIEKSILEYEKNK